MIEFYVLQIQMGRIRLENVPDRWKAAVEQRLAEQEKGKKEK